MPVKRFAKWAWLLAALLLAACVPAKTAAPTVLVFVGSYTPQGEKGAITIERLDRDSGAISRVGQAEALPNPSFLAIAPGGKTLVAVSESEGMVSSYRIDRSSGQLTLLNSQAVQGEGPCYASFDASGKWVLVANYTSGSVSVLPLGEDGKLGAPAAVMQQAGSGPLSDRQEGPHAHSILPAPGSRSLLVSADLGSDQVYLYDLDPLKGGLKPHAVPFLQLKPGTGPRHMVFHPSRPYFYVLGELASTVSAYRYDAAAGSFDEIETQSLLPAGFQGKNTSADIHIDPSSKFLYASNRGADSLAIFAIDANSGKLTAAGQAPSGGKTPRNFAIDPRGGWLLVANQDSGNLVSFRLNPDTGQLTASGAVEKLPQPTCIQILD